VDRVDAPDVWRRRLACPRCGGRLRLVAIEKVHRKPVDTDFEDQMGVETAVPLPEFASVADRAKFLAKARQFLKAHEDHVTIARLRLNQPLIGTSLFSSPGPGQFRSVSVTSKPTFAIGDPVPAHRASLASSALSLNPGTPASRRIRFRRFCCSL
jgi:hypothetical protein